MDELDIFYDKKQWVPSDTQCPYCCFEPCICEQRESDNPFED